MRHRIAQFIAILGMCVVGAARAAGVNGGAPAPAPVALPAALTAMIPAHGAASDSFAKSWTGAFVTGNGTIGAMVMGANTGVNPPRPQEDTLFLTHNRLFLPLGTREVVPQLAESLADFRQTIRSRGYGPAMSAELAKAEQQDFPGLTYPDPFMPAFELKIKMPTEGEVSPAGTAGGGGAKYYLRSEDFQTGEVAVRWRDDNGSFLRKCFVSRADNVVVYWIGPD
ncbi:MAG TPA: glycoside hydrolase N-terminal domain-containing protein, partial [Phycisphaerae bacterium]